MNCLSPSNAHALLSVQLVNHVYFSPDGLWVASASFDKSVKLWNGVTGKFVAAFRGHVGPVYQIRFEIFVIFSSYLSNIIWKMSWYSIFYCSWSADSRLLLSGSKDSTLKVSLIIVKPSRKMFHKNSRIWRTKLIVE